MTSNSPSKPGSDNQTRDIVLQIVDNLDAMVAYWNRDKICVFANDAYRHWFGKTKEQIIGHSMQDLLGPLYEKNLPYIQAAYDGAVQVFEREIPTPDGRIRHSLATYTPHRVEGRVCGIFVHVADVTALKKLELELQAAKERAEVLATHDFLTGLPNRALFFERMFQVISLAGRKDRMFSVLSVDLDNFKHVNDTHGHTVGDKLLVELSARIRSCLRASDTLARLGGDEFIVLASEIKCETDAEIIAGRISSAASQPVIIHDLIMSCPASIGIAVYPKHGTTPEALIAHSDAALYAAKRHGKNGYFGLDGLYYRGNSTKPLL